MYFRVKRYNPCAFPAAMILLILIAFFAAFTQSLTGFGSGLISMSLMPGLIGMKTSVPLVAMMTASLEIILLFRYRKAFKLDKVWRLTLASILAIPFGVWALRSLSDQVLLPILGVVMSGYALYALLDLRLPNLEGRGWAYLTGLLAGLLSGAYSVGGPPVIIYANCRGWDPDEFKGNLQAFFLVNDLFALVNHALVGNLTPTVLTDYGWLVPALGLGLLAGGAVDRYIDPDRFRRIVLVLLFLMGLRFILSAFAG